VRARALPQLLRAAPRRLHAHARGRVGRKPWQASLRVCARDACADVDVRAQARG
jgi:hypothetical protein